MSVTSEMTVDLRLLGHPELRRAGKPIQLPTRNALLLVARLAVEGRQGRDLLATLLWPEADEERARTNLRRTLVYIRDGFGRDAESIVTSHGTVALSDSVTSDVACVQRALEVTPAAALLTQAVTAWRGEFLEGMAADGEELDLWLTEQRSVWMRRLALAAERLVALRSQAGDKAAALQALDIWLARDPLAEQAHRERIRLLLSQADRPAALAAYDRCVAILARELGIEPDAATRALGERARAGDASEAETPQLGPESPMLGREGDHSVLAAAFDSSVRGNPGLVLIKGEPGIGKTRLLREFLTWVGPRGAAVVSIQPFPSARRLAYHAVDAVLGDVIGASQAAPQPGADLHVFRAAADHLDGLAPGAVLVLAVDDLQWVDPDSLRLLGYAIAELRRRGRPMLIVLAVREEDLEHSRRLKEWVAAASHGLTFHEVTLTPLGDEDVQKLLEAWPLTAVDVASDAVSRCGGRPLLVIETLRHLSAGGDPAAVAAPIRSAMESRLRALTSPARRLLASAAVLERAVDLQTAAAVAGLEPQKARAAMAELLRLHVLDGDGLYSFSHELLRQTAYTGLAAEERRALHQTAVRELAKLPGATHAELAQHAELGGDLDSALRWRLSAARQALTVSAYSAASDQFGAALAIDPDALEAWLGLGRAEELAHGANEAADIYKRLLQRAREMGQPVAEAAALIRLAELAGRDFATDMALDLLGEATQAARAAGDETQRLEAELAAAQALSYRTQLARAHALVRNAPARARRLRDPRLEARALNLTAFINQAQGRWGEALRLARQAVAAYSALDEPLMVLDSISYEATALVFLGRWAEALPIAQRGLREALRLGNDWAVCNLSLNEAWALREAGRLEDALAASERGIQAGRAAGFVPLRLLNEALAGRCRRELGDPRSALAVHLESIDESRQRSGVVLQSLTEELTADCAALGDWTGAANWAEESSSAASEMEMFVRLSLWTVAEALVRAGIPFELPRLPEGERYRLVELRTRAALARLAGDVQTEGTLLEEAKGLAQTLSLPVEVEEIAAGLELRV